MTRVIPADCPLVSKHLCAPEALSNPAVGQSSSVVNDLPSFFMEQSFITVQLFAGGLHKSVMMEMALDLFGFGGNR